MMTADPGGMFPPASAVFGLSGVFFVRPAEENPHLVALRVRKGGLSMKSSVKSKVISSAVSIIAVALLYWFWLPPLNPRSPSFWIFLLAGVAIFLAVFSIAGIGASVKTAAGEASVVDFGGTKVHLPSMPKFSGSRWQKILLWVIGGILLLMLLASVIGSTLFNASRYKNLIVKTEGSFTEDIAQLREDQIPVVDRDSAIQLGKRKLGEMSDLVSQFEIAEDYTQINLNGRPVRVTPLIYGDLFKWLANSKNGIPGYIQVDMVNQEATLVRLEGDSGIKYSPTEYLLRDLQRHLRFQFPTKIFDSSSFEVDDAGVPYWITPTMTYRIGLWSGMDVEGAILTNANTGESTYYPVKDVPTWVDKVYRADLLIEQLNYNGRFQSGFWNSYFGQRGVLRTTDGYNYLAIDDDVYLYTGMTSVTGDQSNVGFVLVNMRTKETKFYSVPGAEENSAMSSAQGQVQHLKYTATFPLLLNVENRPTYFLSLKDAAGLVKMYAFVDVERYQIVGTGETVELARAAYEKALGGESDLNVGGEPITGTITEIYPVVVDGNTSYYFQLEGSDTVYIAGVTLSSRLPFLKAGDTVTITCSGETSTVREISFP